MAWSAEDIRFGEDGASSITWSEVCNTSVTGWSKATQLIVAAWGYTPDHTPGSKSLKLRWRNYTDYPEGAFADFVTGSGELRAGTSAGCITNTDAVASSSGCQTSADSEEIENESPLQSKTFSPARYDYMEIQCCIDMSNALDGKIYEFELYDVTGDGSLGIYSYTVTTESALENIVMNVMSNMG